MRIGRLAGYGLVFLSLGIVLAGLLFRQEIEDWNRLRNYSAPPEVAALARDTTMVSSATRLFYVYHPQLADKASFNEYCRENEHSIVLGCYISDQGIYLLDVTDERLAGVTQVTAAHELLHAAYERLSDGDKEKVDRWLAEVYENLDDERIKNTVEAYREQDPGIVPNELHSILGTELRTLTPELEDYYSRYFTDRQKIVDFSDQYEQAFIERRNQIRVYDDQLERLKGQIEGLQSSLESTNTDLATQRNRMNSLRNSDQIEEYNNEVPSYNAKVNAYNRDIDRLQSLITQYNDLVQTRNAVASEEAELVEAIDSRTAVPRQL